MATLHDSVRPTLNAVLSDLDAADREAEAVVGATTDEQANWQPSEGSWSIAQCLDHLARTNTIYAESLLAAIAKAPWLRGGFSGDIRAGWTSRMIVRSLEPPPKKKMPAPKKIVPPAKCDKDQALADFFRSQEVMRGVVRKAAEVDPNRVRFGNPFLPLLRLTVATGLLIVVVHNRRHLWQAEQVRQAKGFPETQ